VAGEPAAVHGAVLKRSGFFAACLLAIVAALLPAASRAAERHRIAPDPGWVEVLPLPADTTGLPAPEGARYLLVDDQVNLLGTEPVWHRRLVEEVVQERALASAARLSIVFQPLYQRVELHAVEILRNGERLDRSRRADLQVLRRESDMESGILDGRLTLQVTTPDVRVGDRIEYRFSVIGANPIFGSDYHDVYSAAYGVPLAGRRLRFLYPPDVEPRHKVGREGYRVTEGGGNGWRSLEFRATDLPPVATEDGVPGWHDEFGRLQFSTLADWAAVADWARPLYPARLRDRRLAADMADALGLDPADPQGALERAIAFVQGDVRYTAIDMGSYSHAPNAPEVVLDRRFGDCKDKSTLLVALLAEAGIRAEPVLVNTVARANVRDRLPSPLAFDHVVVRAYMPGGDAWIDATRGRERAPMAAREPLPFRYGLPVYSGGGLVEIPAPPPTRPVVEVNQRIRLERTGSRASALFGVVTDYRRGDAESIRTQFEDSARKEIGDRYLSYMRRFYDDIVSVAAPAADGTPEAGAIRTVESYRLDWDAGQASTFGIVLFQLGDWLPQLPRGARSAPRVLAGPRHATQTIRVDSAQGWSVEPEHDRVENPWFDFERRVEVDGEDLIVSGTWRRHADEVPAKDYARFRNDMEAARELLVFEVDTQAKPAILSTRAADWAWPAAAMLALAMVLGVAWRRRGRDPLSGMLFAPRSAMAPLLDPPRHWWPVLVLATVTALLGAAPDLAGEARGGNAARALFGLVSAMAWFPLYALLLKGCLRLLSIRAGFSGLLMALAWSCVPYVVFLLLAGLALGGRIWIFNDGHDMQAAELPGVLAGLLLVVAGLCWYLVANINACAVAARTGRGRMFGAVMLSFLFVAGLALAVGLVAAVVYFSRGVAL
jgi:transglutaminase-like putative cysteine protease